ncbi:adenosylcobinamide-phosphate synthase CbiB [Zhaonella formicivorans]|uniref:adenosylcobinamide-phosphate synthase CbiB n=1 Tax=Zhaonella formicivorans TaxID=2528593 RepID=UPI0010E5E55B|nr:adenosylcobinamide-phosphate synthase CbiB [Zhaonella formicivorans]
MGHFLNPEVFLLAVAFDLLIGDPKWLIHPTQIMGYLIAGLEKQLRRFTSTATQELWAGGLLVGIVVLSVYLAAFLLVWFSHRLNYWLGMVVSAWLLSTTIAIKGLAQAGLDIFRVLQSGDLLTARKNLSYIVGRDTEHLSTAEVVRATVETVAENIVDGVISPLFYAILGGTPLAFVYRAINTMDSMLGYKNERYLYFGRVAARVDDAANYIPARVTAGLLLLAAKICGLNWRKGLHHLKSDANKHPSPNSGLPEAAVAGALGVALGGLNFYGGIPSPRAVMGEAIYELEPKHILEVVRLLYCTSALGILFGLATLL